MSHYFKNRITGQGLEPPQELMANPENWRIQQVIVNTTDL